jgi:predicted nucleic-acid-binding Zn-ribbon protein
MAWFSGGDEEMAQADAAGQRYVVAGRPLRCAHCTSERFTGRELPLGSRASALFDVEWLTAGAYAMTCMECSAIQWFAARPERLTP